MRSAMVWVIAGALGCAVEEVEPEPELEVARGADEDPDVACDDHEDQISCLEAGCRWQLLFGVAFDEDDQCELGPAWGLCYGSEFAQPCDDEALLCEDGLRAWVLPGPDDAVVITRSPTSCGLPEHFLPCEELAYEERLAAPSLGAPTSSAPSDAEMMMARACACGCDGPP